MSQQPILGTHLVSSRHPKGATHAAEQGFLMPAIHRKPRQNWSNASFHCPPHVILEIPVWQPWASAFKCVSWLIPGKLAQRFWLGLVRVPEGSFLNLPPGCFLGQEKVAEMGNIYIYFKTKSKA